MYLVGSDLIDRSQRFSAATLFFSLGLEDKVPYKFVWRVVALPGDRIEVNGERISVNGQPLIREEVRGEGRMTIFREVNGKSSYEVAYPKNGAATDQPQSSLTVSENHLFVLGDNRFNARDSRYFGPIPFSSVVAKTF